MKLSSSFYKLCFLLLPVFAASCKKEIIPPPSPNDPVFKAEGTFGGTSFTLNAGDDGALMTPDVEKINNIDFYKGTLGNGDLKLELGIFSGNVDMPEATTPDFSNITQINFAQQSYQPLVTLCRDSMPNRDLISQVNWYVNGIPTAINTLKIYNAGKYEICAHVLFNDGTLKMLCNEVVAGFRSNADFNLNFFIGQDLKFKGWIGGSSNSTIESASWYQDDVLMNEGTSLGFDVSPGLHTIKVVAVFTNGVRKTHSVVIDGDLSGKYIDDFTKNIQSSALELDYTAKIKLTRNGSVYVSETIANNNNKIIVEEITYHGINSSGFPVYILKGKLNANLRNTSSLEVLPLQLNVSIGLAVK